MATGDQIAFRFSGASSYEAAQTDPNASLGNWMSSTTPYHTEGSLTSAMTLENEFVDTAQIGNGNISVGDWLIFVTGANSLEARKITAFTSGTGFFRLRDPLPSLGGIGDVYRIHALNNLFDAVSTAESEAGRVEYRGIFTKNVSGGVLNNPRIYWKPISGGATMFEVATDDGTANQFGETLSSETDEPDLSLLGANVRFERFYEYDHAFETFLYWNNNAAIRCWLRRTVPPVMAEQDDTVWALVVETTDTGGDPDPLTSAFLIVFAADGYTPDVSISADRHAYIGGGARIRTRIESGGVPIPDEYLEFSILDGPGTIYNDPGNDVTDENGEHLLPFHSPTVDVVRTQGDPEIEFTLVPAGLDLIDRDVGSFLADGFTDGMFIAIDGSDLNDGFQTILTALAAQLKIDADVLATEGPTLFVELSEATRIRVRVV